LHGIREEPTGERKIGKGCSVTGRQWEWKGGKKND